MAFSHPNEMQTLFRSRRFSPLVLIPAIAGVAVAVDAARSFDVQSYPFIGYMLGAVTLWGFALMSLREKFTKGVFLFGDVVISSVHGSRHEIPVAGAVAKIIEIPHPALPPLTKSIPIHHSYEPDDPPQKALVIEHGDSRTFIDGAAGLSPRRMQVICDRINEAARDLR